MKILILGASGMIGNAMMRVLSENKNWDVFGTIRSEYAKRFFSTKIAERLISGIDVENYDVLVRVLAEMRADVVINCVGLTKHLPGSENPLKALPINALLSHRLAGLCDLAEARLVHISTDCVFSGENGKYVEDDPADAKDIYGKSKYLGEVSYPHAITLRTSTIGPELQTTHGLLDWFLSQQERCKGFKRAIFSGLPTMVFAQLIRDIVIPRPDLFGLYHVAGPVIAKFDLLQIIAEVYGKKIDIVPDEQLVIDRSLNADRFRAATGYVAPEWAELIKQMHAYQ